MRIRTVLINIIVVIIIVAIAVPLNFAQSHSEIEELIKKAGSSVEKSIKETYQGTGVARVLIHKEAVSPAEIKEDFETGETTIIKPRGTKTKTQEEKFLVDFAFKGENSTAKRYEIKENGERGKLLSATINTPEIRFHYDGSFGVRAPTKSFKMLYRERGYDFHPDTLTRLDGMPFSQQMEMFLKFAKVINVNSINDGLLQIKLEGDKICDYCSVSAVLVLNPQADFRPIEYTYAFENKKEIYSSNIIYKAKWKQYPSTWYITDLKYEDSSEFKGELPTKYRVEIEVLSFDPDTKVEDSRFDFKNLDIPKGTPVYDRIEGIDYKWGE